MITIKKAAIKLLKKNKCPMTEFCKLIGIDKATVHRRQQNGWRESDVVYFAMKMGEVLGVPVDHKEICEEVTNDKAERSTVASHC